MNEFYFVIDLLNHGCIGTPYKSLEESIKAGDYQVWDKNRIKRAFNFGNGTMKDFINHCKINKEKVLTEKEFINKYEFYYNRDIEFINEEKRFCLRGFNKNSTYINTFSAHKDRLYLAGQFTAVRTIAIMQETLIY